MEANAILYVRQFAALEVAAGGELYFEQYANGDDVRQAKIVGKFLVNGGTVYDKSTDGRQLQYVTSIKEGGRLVFAGGTVAQGKHETNLLGVPNFTGTGEIRLVFSDGWSKYNPVAPTAGDTLISNATPPTFDGFEIIGEIEITGNQLTIPDNNGRVIKAIVRKDAKLKIGKNASLMSEYATPGDIGNLLIEEGASVEVEGKLEIPGVAGNANRGLITVKQDGVLLNGGTTITANMLKVGTIVLEKGAIAMLNRVNSVPWASPGGTGAIKTNGTQITLTDTSLTFKDGGADYNVGFAPAVDFPAPAAVINVVLDKAAVNFKAAVTLAAGTTLSANNGSKAVFDIAFGANTGAVTASASEITFNVPGGNLPLGINLTNKSTGIFDYKGNAVAFPPASTTVTVDSKDSTISYLGSQTLTIASGIAAGVLPFLRNAGLKFDMPVVVADGGLSFNNVNAVFNKGLEIKDTAPAAGTAAGINLELDNNSNLTVNGPLALADGALVFNKSTATLASVTFGATTFTGQGIALTNTGVVTLKGTLLYPAGVPGIISLDTNSSLKGPAGVTDGVARIIADAAVTVTIPATPADWAGLPGITASLVAGTTKTWDGTKWD